MEYLLNEGFCLGEGVGLADVHEAESGLHVAVDGLLHVIDEKLLEVARHYPAWMLAQGLFILFVLPQKDCITTR